MKDADGVFDEDAPSAQTVMQEWELQRRDDLQQQNERNKSMLESIFDIRPEAKITVKGIEGLLDEYVDEGASAQDLVRSVRN